MKYYKVLGTDGRPCHGGTGKWNLPTWDGEKWIAGDWMPVIERVVPCESGYHLCREGDLIEWLDDSIYEAEIEDGATIITESHKVVTGGRVRLLSMYSNWNEYTARLFACDCAEHTLHIFEKERPNDNRPRLCIETARQFASGEATEDDLDAAWAAARAAAWAVAGDAAWDAARAAAGDAAWDAAWDAERKWQTQRILEYIHGQRP